jgi:hypothetical protein
LTVGCKRGSKDSISRGFRRHREWRRTYSLTYSSPVPQTSDRLQIMTRVNDCEEAAGVTKATAVYAEPQSELPSTQEFDNQAQLFTDDAGKSWVEFRAARGGYKYNLDLFRDGSEVLEKDSPLQSCNTSGILTEPQEIRQFSTIRVRLLFGISCIYTLANTLNLRIRIPFMRCKWSAFHTQWLLADHMLASSGRKTRTAGY